MDKLLDDRYRRLMSYGVYEEAECLIRQEGLQTPVRVSHPT
jgi:hypothetical protein